MKKVTVFVVGYEALESGAVSFWDWYPIKESASKREAELRENPHCKGGKIYAGSVVVEGVIEDIKNITEEDKEDITQLVELFLEANNWENSFN